MSIQRVPFRHLLDPRFAHCADEASVAAVMLQAALELMGTKQGNVQLLCWTDRAGLKIAAQQGFNDTFLDCFRSVSWADSSACGRSLRTRKATVIVDVLKDAGFLPFLDVAKDAGFRSVQSTPLMSSSGAFIGMISTHAAEPQHPSDGQLLSVARVATAAANAIIRLRVLARTPGYAPIPPPEIAARLRC